jgi:hypothetical protein
VNGRRGAMAFGVEVAMGINSVGVLLYDIMNVLLANVVLEVVGTIDRLKWLADSRVAYSMKSAYEVMSNDGVLKVKCQQ